MWAAASALLVVVLVLAILFYFYGWKREQAPEQASNLGPPPDFVPSSGYWFHLGHTWVADQGREIMRVGIDAFAATLLGKVQKITVIGEQRWVRQGQKLATLTCDGESIEMLSPVEGVITAINPEVIKDPGLAVRDPYQQGWLCSIKSPEIETNLRNLVPAASVGNWMENSLDRLKILAEADSSLAQNGGTPMRDVLAGLTPQLRRQVVKEFFLT